jgi:glycosyltransferase involved in cell wall biosynthesis
MRYAWDLQHQYLRSAGLNRSVKGCVARVLLHYLRQWDQSAAQRVDHLIANSRYIARRIQKCYRQTATVIYPPVDTNRFSFCPKKDDYYVTISRMVPYKRVDVIVEAFAKMPNRKLVVIGEGPDEQRIKALAGPNVQILGHQSSDVVRDYLQRARAFVFAAEEDFGITTVEAQACGTPVIAFGRGGSTETVLAEETGVFFPEQTADSVKQAVEHFETIEHRLDPYQSRIQAERFSVDRFRRRLTNYTAKAWEHFCAKRRGRRVRPKVNTSHPPHDLHSL